MGVSENSGTPKSSILIGLSIINHPFWGTLIFGNTHICNTFSETSSAILNLILGRQGRFPQNSPFPEATTQPHPTISPSILDKHIP